jgi:hypothetical protein
MGGAAFQSIHLMKILLTSILIISATASAFADHTAFVPKSPAAPTVTEVPNSTASVYLPYSRNSARVAPFKSATQNDISNRPASRYPAYTRNNPRSQPTSAHAVSAAGANSQKRSDVNDK